jgi:hypothetical protein
MEVPSKLLAKPWRLALGMSRGSSGGVLGKYSFKTFEKRRALKRMEF